MSGICELHKDFDASVACISLGNPGLPLTTFLGQEIGEDFDLLILGKFAIVEPGKHHGTHICCSLERVGLYQAFLWAGFGLLQTFLWVGLCDFEVKDNEF